MKLKPGKILAKIDGPADLKRLNFDELLQLSRELRQYIIDVVSCNPGHFGASLGVVELTVALHYVFEMPYDQVVWDVGHQAYGHKILTGRRDDFHTNRKYKGVSGFPKRSESEYDSFGVGHSSTSISAALGMAIASKISHEEQKNIVAVIGDGSMTAGLAFEGLNNAGSQNSNLLVILNDNNMAIDPNVGALKEYLLDITTSKTYNRFRNDVWKMLSALRKIGANARPLMQQIETGLKSIILKQSNLFEAFNFRYFGPVDGHDLFHLVKVLEDLKNIKGPKVLHVRTTKGKGFLEAEKNQTKFHAPGLFDKKTGEIFKSVEIKPKPPRYQDVFGETIVELAIENKKIVGVTPAMPTGSSLNIMMEKIPERAFDVGIAEQHAVTFSGGLATQGFIPFCNIYSSFMQRAYDQVIHDVALQNLDVVFCLDRGGLVGADGATHHGAYDLAFMRCIPNITIASPLDEIELRNLMFTAQLGGKGSFVIRYPRGVGENSNWKQAMHELEIGKGECIRDGKDIAILTIGPVGSRAMRAAKTLINEGIDVAVYNMRFVKPIDEELLHSVFEKFKKIITIEDGTIIGGLGSAVLEFMSENDYSAKVKRLGIPDKFIDHGTQAELYKECSFDKEAIIETVRNLVQKNN